MDLYTKIFSQNCFDINNVIKNQYQQLEDDDFLKKTHRFNDRYENLYLEVRKLPKLGVIINTALEKAAEILDVKKKSLTSGFWLNEMNAGDVTTAHTHDDDDEILSCVYYIKVPENSGNLIITENNKKHIIKPEEGSFIFFSPDTLHEVSKNESSESRLSIAFNFGLMKS